MRILIFGKTGQVASELCLQAKAAGFDYVALSRNEVDVSNSDSIRAAICDHSCDVIINASAYTNVDGADSEKELANQINTHAPYEMAKAAAQKKVPFLHISTDYVFPGDGDQPWKIQDKIDPINHYGLSKAKGEELISTVHGRNIIMRTSWVFSTFGKNFVKTILRIAETNDELNIVGDQVGGPTSASDIASALLIIAQQECRETIKTGTQLIHYSGQPCVSWAEFANAIAINADLKTQINSIPTSEYPTPAKRPLNSRLDLSDLPLLYGITAPDWRISLDDCIKRIRYNEQA